MDAQPQQCEVPTFSTDGSVELRTRTNPVLWEGSPPISSPQEQGWGSSCVWQRINGTNEKTKAAKNKKGYKNLGALSSEEWKWVDVNEGLVVVRLKFKEPRARTFPRAGPAAILSHQGPGQEQESLSRTRISDFQTPVKPSCEGRPPTFRLVGTGGDATRFA